jgi:competence protein ComEA
MKFNRLAEHRASIILALLALTVIGALLLLERQPWSTAPLEITLSRQASAAATGVEAYVGGAVANPGWYTLGEGVTVAEVIAMAGGLASGADPTQVRLYVPTDSEGASPQLISINRAGAWLLQALPGIGPTLAQNIIDYRQANGPFATVEQLLLVPGIGQATCDGLVDMVTVE